MGYTPYVPPTAEEAMNLATLLDAGVPMVDAVRIVAPQLDPTVVADTAIRWEKDRAVRTAQVRLMPEGKDWRALTEQERIEYALRKHFNQMAYFLAAHNYGDLESGKRAKADACREALLKRLASLKGTGDPLEDFTKRFMQTVLSGELKLQAKEPDRVQ